MLGEPEELSTYSGWIASLTERRADLDLHIGLLTEHELIRVLLMPDAIQDKLGIVDHESSGPGRP